MKQKVCVIGAGFSGLVSAGVLAKEGFEVSLYEKNLFLGGRASSMNIEGFHFDKGPSWYWMPEVYDQAFHRMGVKRSDYYSLTRLDPGFRVYFDKLDYVDIPDDYNELRDLFENMESGGAVALDRFMKEAREKYTLGVNGMARMPSVSWMEFLSPALWKSAMKMDLFSSVADHVQKRFKNERIRKIMEFPVLFLGASASRIPALYTMMNYAGMCLGTYYPSGGFAGVVKGFENVVKDLGVEIYAGTAVTGFETNRDSVTRIVLEDKQGVETDFVVGSADYVHIDTLLASKKRNYKSDYWKKKVFAPSALLYYVGINKKLEDIEHHNLFFHAPFDKHIDTIYSHPSWPDDPLFYVCCPSRTDEGIAPVGHENLFFLIPIATGLEDSEEIREHYFSMIISRFEEVTGENIKEHIVVKKSYGLDDFKQEYNAYGGNAYGLANTLRQTAVLKPSIRHRKLHNLFYAGQLTVPGPGVPPALISGEIVADYIIKNYQLKNGAL